MKILFLSYVNRSGSTYLLNLLSSSPDIMACPEGDWPVIHLLEDPPAKYSFPGDLDQVFRSDPKMKQWQLESRDFNEIRGDLTNLEVFIRLLETTRRRFKPGAKTVVFKAERLVYLFDRINRCRSSGPEFVFLYLMRDIRAVWLSQKNTLNPLTGKPFSSSAALTAVFWKRHLMALEKHSSRMKIVRIRYEQLVRPGEEFYSELEKSISMEGFSLDPLKGDYSAMVPPGHRSIHPDISAGPNTARMDAWKTELNESEVKEIELVAGNTLQYYGYSLSGSPVKLGYFRRLRVRLSILFQDLELFLRKVEFNLKKNG